jgi:hypothetical protein
MEPGPALIVSLPQNSQELAQAAKAGGADALKVHINVAHEASGTRFASLAEERPALEKVLALGLPTGLVAGGAERVASPSELREIISLGFDFVDLYAHHWPAWMLGEKRITKIAAVDGSYGPHQVSALMRLGFEALEAAIVPPEGYRRPLTARDLASYSLLREATARPIIVPTQRAISPEEAPLLVRDLGLNAVMIGAVVTGKDPRSLEQATAAFKQAIASLRTKTGRREKGTKQ